MEWTVGADKPPPHDILYLSAGVAAIVEVEEEVPLTKHQKSWANIVKGQKPKSGGCSGNIFKSYHAQTHENEHMVETDPAMMGESVFSMPQVASPALI